MWPTIDSNTVVILLGAVMAVVIALVVLWQFRRAKYDVLDILMDHTTGKASLDAHVVVFFCALAAWYIVTSALRGLSVGSELIQIIGIMVIYRGAKQGISAYANKPPPPPALPAQVDQQINVSRDPPAEVASTKKRMLPSAIRTE